jgi:hypothetical protein
MSYTSTKEALGAIIKIRTDLQCFQAEAGNMDFIADQEDFEEIQDALCDALVRIDRLEGELAKRIQNTKRW